MNFRLLFESAPRNALELELAVPNQRRLHLVCRVTYTSQHRDEHLIGVEILRMSETDRADLRGLVETFAGRYERGCVSRPRDAMRSNPSNARRRAPSINDKGR